MADASSFRVQCMVAIHAQLVYNLQQHIGTISAMPAK